MWCGQQHYHIEPCGKGGGGGLLLVILGGLVVFIKYGTVIERGALDALEIVAITIGSMMVLSTAIICAIIVHKTRQVRPIKREDVKVINYTLYPPLENRKEEIPWPTEQQQPSNRIGDW